MGLLSQEKSLTIALAVWIQSTNVTDRQTDRQTDTGRIVYWIEYYSPDSKYWEKTLCHLV